MDFLLVGVNLDCCSDTLLFNRSWHSRLQQFGVDDVGSLVGNCVRGVTASAVRSWHWRREQFGVGIGNLDESYCREVSTSSTIWRINGESHNDVGCSRRR